MSDDKIHLLIVEDNPDHAFIIEREVRKRLPDAQVDYVEGGEACLEKLAWRPYAAVVLDYSLPQMNGLEVLARIVEECFDVPVIMISGQGNETIAASAIKGGAVDYIVKGPDYAQNLLQAVVSAIERRGLKCALAEKEGEIRRRDEEIERRNRELSRIDTLKNEFVANIVHSMREPIVSIRGYCDLLAGGALGEVNGEQKRALAVCLRNADKLLAAIEETVSFADATVPDYVPVRETEANEILEDAVTTVLPKAISRRVKVSFDPPEALYRVKGDARRLCAAFASLLDIALLATAPDATVRVRAAAGEDGRALLVTVANSALPRPGVDAIPESRRAEAAAAAARIADIVALHHGDFSLATDDGRFTARVRMPLSSTGALAAERDASPAGPRDDRPGTILIVDDDKDCLDLLAMILARDWRTVAAKCGNRLFEVLESGERIDMILLDINMFDINGIDACRRVKADPRFAHIPIYMISATLGEDKKLLSLEAGASGFIEKPFEMETILNFIRRVFPAPGKSAAGARD